MDYPSITEHYDDSGKAKKSIELTTIRRPAVMSPVSTSRNPIKRMRVEATIAEENDRARLVQSAMMNTAALSSLEGYLSGIVPNASKRLKAIVDVYAVKAAYRAGRD